MWHTVMNVEDGGMYNQRRESTKCSQVLPADGQCLTMDSPTSVDSPSFEHIPSCYFCLDNRYLLDPKLLFVGPRIGEGAHAKVYEGKYCEQNVAIKITQRGETPEELAKRQRRFSREISMLARVQHKNLVKFIGACKEPVMVVVTELLQGGSLRKYLMNLRPKRLDIQIAVSFALDIAQAMDRLHKHGIIHRDLKPDNLILTSDHKTVKLVDFGLAREETLTEMMTAETGTYRWMAPELYSTVTLRHGEKKHYNHKVDVYSFAIVLWELLTNRMPFEGMSNLQAAYAAAFKGTRPTLSGNLNLPEDLVFIMQSCWEEDPNVRPDFTQIVRMLNAFLSSLVPQEYTAPQQQVVSKDASSTWSANDKQEEPMMANPEVIQNQKSSVLKCFCQCFSQGHIRTSSFQGY